MLVPNWMPSYPSDAHRSYFSMSRPKTSFHGSRLFWMHAGTYIKEFVHGDFGRTVPNLATLLGGGCEADILSLDVEVRPVWDGKKCPSACSKGGGCVPRLAGLLPPLFLFAPSRPCRRSHCRDSSAPRWQDKRWLWGPWHRGSQAICCWRHTHLSAIPVVCPLPTLMTTPSACGPGLAGPRAEPAGAAGGEC